MGLKAKNLVGQYNFIMISRPLMAYFKDANILMMMHALIEGEVACADNAGWFYQTVDAIEDMYFLSRKQQDRAVGYLIENGFIYKKITGLPARRYFKINNEKLTKVMLDNSEVLCNKWANQYVQKGQTVSTQTDKPYINKEISNKEISNKEKAQSQAIDAPPPKKRKNTVDWDWTDRLIEKFGVSEQVAKDFITARKVKRAVITETVLSHFQIEVKKVNDAGVYFAEREAFAYWVASGWQGFKADWYLKGQQPSGGGFKQKETIEECMARLSTSESAREELDVTPSQNGLGLPVFDYLEDSDPFACQQQNNA